MIYGPGSKGNYQKLSKLARITPIFPDYDNERSMLFIDNLCEFIRLVIIYEESGLIFPQNKEYVKTSELVRMIAQAHGKKIWITRYLNFLIKLGLNIDVFKKLFGNFVYDKESNNKIEFTENFVSLKQSISSTERVV